MIVLFKRGSSISFFNFVIYCKFIEFAYATGRQKPPIQFILLSKSFTQKYTYVQSALHLDLHFKIGYIITEDEFRLKLTFCNNNLDNYNVKLIRISRKLNTCVG